MDMKRIIGTAAIGLIAVGAGCGGGGGAVELTVDYNPDNQRASVAITIPPKHSGAAACAADGELVWDRTPADTRRLHNMKDEDVTVDFSFAAADMPTCAAAITAHESDPAKMSANQSAHMREAHTMIGLR